MQICTTASCQMPCIHWCTCNPFKLCKSIIYVSLKDGWISLLVFMLLFQLRFWQKTKWFIKPLQSAWSNKVRKCNSSLLIRASYNFHLNLWKPAKKTFTKTCKILLNSLEIIPNTLYLSVQHIKTCYRCWGCLTCCKLVNFLWNFITAMSKEHPKTTRH